MKLFKLSESLRPIALSFTLLLSSSLGLFAQQSPWGSAATKLATEFTGPIARGLALVAIVIGGLTLAFSEGGGRRAIGGLIFGLGMALGAAQMVTWLFG
jgi:type IV secretion system protein TrbC